MFVVLEGLDGAGKSTQVNLLKEYLTERTGTLEYIHFPRYDAPVYGDLISRFLRGEFGDNAHVHPQLVALLFAEDRHGAAAQMRQVLEEGKTLLLDRYVYSNIAYQCAKLRDPQERLKLRNWIFRTEFEVFGLPKPDLNLFLDVPIGFVEQSLANNREGADRAYLEGQHDIHEADIAFQREVRDIYRQESAREPHLLRIDCSAPDGDMLPAADIFDRVREVVDGHLQ